jgi:hypothetical protein
VGGHRQTSRAASHRRGANRDRDACCGKWCRIHPRQNGRHRDSSGAGT